MRSGYLVFGAIVALLVSSMSFASVVGTASIQAPAVIIYNNTGSLTTIKLTVTNGTGVVSFLNASEVANDTRASAETAAMYASSYAGKNFSHYDFTYDVLAGGANVSGPSAGAAMTILAISALENRQLRSDFTMTGTIGPNGQIGQIGGAIDKVSAAKAAHLDLVLVPGAAPGSLEDGIYYIAQEEYSIPVVEVSNISQAAYYAFSTASGTGNEVSINFSVNYKLSGLPTTTLSCSNDCNEAPFAAFSNYTIGITRSEIANLSPAFSTSRSQLVGVANQAAEIHSKGYNYISADISFLGYLDAFYLANYNMTRNQAYSYMTQVQSDCQYLTAPELTLNNYEYVIGGELRQGWANYTINQSITNFNVTGATRDDIVSTMYSTGQAKAWCGAVTYLYDYQYGGVGAPVTFSQSLSQLATERINRADAYQGMYLTLAKQEDRQGNYPVAIIDADYAYALSQSAPAFNVSQMNNASTALAANSTYGVWATEFSKEALFYAYESGASSNVTQAQFYADEAYSTAVLASQLSNDTRQIYQGLVAAPTMPTTTTIASGGGTYTQVTVNDSYVPGLIYDVDALQQRVQILTNIVAIVLALLIGCIMLVAALTHKVLVLSARLRKEEKGKRRGR